MLAWAISLVCQCWLRVLVDGRPLLVAPSNLHKGLLVAMRVWVLDSDDLTPHVIGVIMT